MKYLKLITEPALPNDKHITFAYFGENEVNKTLLLNHLKKINTFYLKASHNSMFESNNDIPCIVFDISKDMSDMDTNDNITGRQIQEIREKMLSELGEKIVSQNRMNWTPHISNIQMEDLEVNTYKVIGIKSNNELFGIYF